MTIEVTAKKVEDAIAQGLSQLGATLDDVTVEVVDAGGLFKKAKVRLTLDAPEAKSEVKEEKAPAVEKHEEKASEAPAPAAKPEAKETPAPAPQKTEKRPVEKAVKKAKAGEAGKDGKSEKPSQEQKSDSEQKAAPARSKKQQKPASATDTAANTDATSAAPDTDTTQSEDIRSKEKPSARVLKKEDREAAGHALEFVKKTVELMGFSGIEITADSETGEHIDINAPEGDDSLIIGRHGETLSALTYLAETCARAEKCRLNIVVDCNGYRGRRAKSLTSMARRRAHECASKRRKIKLEPMDRIDRRTVHMALAEDAYVTTESEGKEPYRCVVIVPKAGEREQSKDDRKDRREKRDRDRGDRNAPRPKRPIFDMKLYGKVGHNDNVTAEDSEKVDQQ